MKIYISSPGQFYEGFNSKLRGEGRWLVHLAGILHAQGHDVTIFSNDPVKPYQHMGVNFSSVFNQLEEPNCDLMFAMDAFPDLPELHKTNVTPYLGQFKPKKRVWASFFPASVDHPIYDYIPVIHPWEDTACDAGKGICLPIVTHHEVKPPGFDRNRFHWYSKNGHEEPQHIAGVMLALFKLVKEHGTVGSFVDGVGIASQRYRKDYPEPKEQMVKALFKEIIINGSECFASWAPYDYVQELMSKSKMLVGVHHPVAAPSHAEIAAYGGFPLVFGNQKECSPYNKVDIPFIPQNSTDDEVTEFILKAWHDEKFFTDTVLTCQAAIEHHRYDNVYKRVEQYMKDL